MSGADMRCSRCRRVRTVFPLHGVDKGGPLMCPPCAIEIEESYREKKNRLLWVFGLGDLETRRSPAGPKELTAELLRDALKLTHPDRHPPERTELAQRVTAELAALKPYVRPAPKPKPVTDNSCPAGAKPQNRLKLPSFPCVRCLAYPPMYYCASCRAEWEKRQREERERVNARRRQLYAQRRVRERYRQGARECEGCGEPFQPKRKNATHCSPACRQKAYRLRQRHSEATP